MKKSIYIIPSTETIEIKASGVLMGSKGMMSNPETDPTDYHAPKRRVY